jgi:hypothetical protein
MNLASVASVCYIVFHIIPRPRHIGDEFAVEFAEFHGPNTTAPSVMDLLANLAVIPSVDDAASVWKEIKDVYREGLLCQSNLRRKRM